MMEEIPLEGAKNPALNGHLKLFILAGEPSGDRIAADLIVRLKQRVPLALIGVGGPELEQQGLRSFFPMNQLSVMGVSDVIRRLPVLLWRIVQTARYIKSANPDIVVLVDAQDFSRILARCLKRLGYKGKLLLYVAPSVWARSPGRAARLTPLFEEVLAVLPFEPVVMQKLGGPKTSYVGHPALNERLVRDNVERGALLLLPGSREGELRRHLPTFRALAEDLVDHPVIDGFVIPTLPALEERIGREVDGWTVPVQIVSNRVDRIMLYQKAMMALVVSGTATLELALAQVPMVVHYIMDRHQAKVYDKIGRPVVSLPNIVLKRSVVPEFVQENQNIASVYSAIINLLGDAGVRQRQIEAFAELAVLMNQGDAGSPRQDPADRVLAYWKKRG